MAFWSSLCSYQPQLQPLFGGYNPYNFSMPNFMPVLYGNNFGLPSLFSVGMPRYNSSNYNIFGFTPPANFCYMPQLDVNQTYMKPVDLTSGLFNYSAPSHTKPSSGLFKFLRVTKKTVTPSTERRFNTNTNLPSLQDAGYNKDKAQILANEIAKYSSENGFDGYCARHVKQAIKDANLGSYKTGHAYQMPQILANNKNFKEISTKGINLSSLPAGCILVYDRGVSNYSSAYGHTEITLGNGTAGSGGITHNIRPGARVFVPV